MSGVLNVLVAIKDPTPPPPPNGIDIDPDFWFGDLTGESYDFAGVFSVTATGFSITDYYWDFATGSVAGPGAWSITTPTQADPGLTLNGAIVGQTSSVSIRCTCSGYSALAFISYTRVSS